jgi:hypothetical protein
MSQKWDKSLSHGVSIGEDISTEEHDMTDYDWRPAILARVQTGNPGGHIDASGQQILPVFGEADFANMVAEFLTSEGYDAKSLPRTGYGYGIVRYTEKTNVQ